MSMLRTSAKCVIHTSKGDLEVELWAKECPKTCRAFIEGALNGEFNKGKLNNYVKEQYLQLVRLDTNGESDKLCSATEPNSRLGVSQDGVLCWNIRQDTWLISASPWTSYNNREYTVFGVIVGESIYKFRDMLKGDLEVDEPKGISTFLYPALIENIEVTVPFFDNLPKRSSPSDSEKSINPPQKKQRIARNVKLSFADDDSEEESDDDIQEPSKPLPKLKMRASPMLKFKKSKGNREVKEESAEDITKQNEEPKVGTKSNSDEQSDASNDRDQLDASNDSSLSERERKTLAMMAKFKSATKNKNILSKFDN